MKLSFLTDCAKFHIYLIIDDIIMRAKNMGFYKKEICVGCGETFKLPTRHINKYCSMECKFWSKVNKVIDKDSCWLWTGHLNRHGYGRYENTTTHRISYEFTHGEIPEGKSVLHACDVRNCCRPDHLFLGTPKDNALDCAIKNRTSQGKLTAAKVQLILKDTRPNVEVAKDYGVKPSAISRIKTGIVWKHVEGERNPVGQAKGERGGTARFKTVDIINIRADKRTLREIATQYATHHSVISSIKTGRSWAHIEGPLDIRGDQFGKVGEEAPSSKLTEEQVKQIKLDIRNNAEISKDYGVSRSAIKNIKLGHNWKHVESELRLRDPSLNIRRGQDHPRFKYNQEMVTAIKSSDKSRKELALEYNITETAVKNIRRTAFRCTENVYNRSNEEGAKDEQ